MCTSYEYIVCTSMYDVRNDSYIYIHTGTAIYTGISMFEYALKHWDGLEFRRPDPPLKVSIVTRIDHFGPKSTLG